MTDVLGLLSVLLVAGVLVALGVVGWRAAPRWGHRTMSSGTYEERVALLRRGSAACWAVGAFLIAGSAYSFLTSRG